MMQKDMRSSGLEIIGSIPWAHTSVIKLEKLFGKRLKALPRGRPKKK
ncbi:MAG: hypothetical protein ABIH08_02265 [Candidatus Omnitrophota bacterium]